MIYDNPSLEGSKLEIEPILDAMRKRGSEYQTQVERENKHSLTLKDIEFNYLSWLSEKTALVFMKEGKLMQFLAPKRGNAAYRRRIEKRFYPIHALLSENYFGYGASPYLWVTLTYNGSLDIETAWREVGKQYNSFITNMRAKFGKIYVVRCFEAQKRGYPHIHALLWFQERHFPYFQSGKTYRICDPETLKRMKDAWKSGFSDIQVFKSGKYAAGYLFKYITKMSDDSNSPQSLLNFALQWFYEKRSFSVSNVLKKLSKAFDLTRGQLLNSNSSLEESPEKAIFMGINTRQGFVPVEQFKNHLKEPNSRALRRLEAYQTCAMQTFQFFLSCERYSWLVHH